MDRCIGGVVVEEARVSKVDIEKKRRGGGWTVFIGKREGWIYICRCWWSLQSKVVCGHERCGTVHKTGRKGEDGRKERGFEERG